MLLQYAMADREYNAQWTSLHRTAVVHTYIHRKNAVPQVKRE